MKVKKYPIIPDRIRRPPPEGWSWIDRRFFREYAQRLHHHTVLLYVFLISVGDKYGLSYYSDSTIACRLPIPEHAIVRARDELLVEDLLAYEFPLYQVLALPQHTARRAPSEPTAIADIMREVLERGGEAACRDDERGGRSP